LNTYSIAAKEPVATTKGSQAWDELESSVQAALETYSNVHRGSGHNSIVSTHLFEQARDIVLEYLELDQDRYAVIFGTPRSAELLKARLKPDSYQMVSSQELGLALGVRALAVERRALPGGAPFQPGGGTARLVFPSRTIWAKAPGKFEAGTPAIVSVIAFAKALRLVQRFGRDAFQDAAAALAVGAREPAADEKHVASEILHHDEPAEYAGRELLAELRQTLIGRGLRVPTAEGPKPYVNLDNAASTPTFSPIWDAVRQTWRQPRKVQQAIVGEVASICASVLGAPLAAYEVIFASNTTEAINLVAESLRLESEPDIKPVVLNTLLEHNSNELPWRMLPGFSQIRFPVDDEGFLDYDELELLLRAYNQEGQHGKRRIRLVAMSGASNVLGACNNLAEIARIVHRYGARLLVDAAQLVAHRKVEMEEWGIDYLAFSAHKVYAPFGTGVLLARKELLNFAPDELAQIQASGEENAGGIAATGKSLLLLQRIGLDLIEEEERALTERALRGLAQVPDLEVFGIKDPASPRFSRKGGVIVFRLERMMADRVARELAERGGIGVRSGCHCAHLLIKHLLHIHPLLAQFQGMIVSLFPQVSLPGLTRVSLGIENSVGDVDELIRVLEGIARQPRAGADNPFASTKTAVQRQMDEFARAAAQRVFGSRAIPEEGIR
jgi:selenocysteine lyase/cysteine desulfurase